MPFGYERDEGNHRVVVTYSGQFATADCLAMLARHREEKVGSYALLYDFSRVTGQPTVADLRVLMREAADLPSEPSRGPMAIVASDPIIYNMACTYAALGRPKLTIEVFRERGEAEAWLTAQIHR